MVKQLYVILLFLLTPILAQSQDAWLPVQYKPTPKIYVAVREDIDKYIDSLQQVNTNCRFIIDSLYQENLVLVNQYQMVQRDFQGMFKDYTCEVWRAESLQVRLDTTLAKFKREKMITNDLLEKLRTMVYWDDSFTVYRNITVPGNYAVTIRVTGQHNGDTGMSKLTLGELLLNLRKKPDEKILD